MKKKINPPRRYSLLLSFLSLQKYPGMFCRCFPFLSPAHPGHHPLQNAFGFHHSQLVKITALFPGAKANGHFCPSLTQLLGSRYSARQPLTQVSLLLQLFWCFSSFFSTCPQNVGVFKAQPAVSISSHLRPRPFPQTL